MAIATKLLIRGGLVIAGALAALAAAEVGLRLWSGATGEVSEDLSRALSAPPATTAGQAGLADLLQPSADPDRIYELRSGLEWVFKGVEVTTNSFGMRDRELTLAKADGTSRVVGLGDSVMFGWGVRVDDGYMRVAERMLAPKQPGQSSVEFLNFGVPGYNTAMQVALFEDLAVRFDPDAVVIHFVNNDLDLPRFMLESADPWTLDRLWLADLVTGGWTAVADRGGWVSPRDVAEMGGRRGARVREKYAHLAGEGPFRRAMAKLAEGARARSVPVVFLTLQVDGEPWKTGAAVAGEHGFQVVAAGPRYLEFMARHGIEPSRAGWIRTFSVSGDDPHPNATGHVLFAETLVEALLDVGIGDRR